MIKNFALRHPFVSGMIIFFAVALIAFAAGYWWVVEIVIPNLVKSQNPDYPSDVAGMGALAAFVLVTVGSLLLGLIAGILSSIIFFVKRKSRIEFINSTRLS